LARPYVKRLSRAFTYIMYSTASITSTPLTDDWISESSISIYDSISSIRDQWLSSGAQDLFFGFDFLNVVERFPPSDIIPYYGLVEYRSSVVGVLYFQTKDIKLLDHLRLEKTQGYLRRMLKKCVTSCINFHCTVCGNTMLTGNYGFYFTSIVPDKDYFTLVDRGIHSLKQTLIAKNKKPGLVLVKDIMSTDISDEWKVDEYHLIPFTVQPKMLIHLEQDWHRYEDYISAMKSKYRVRMNKARSLVRHMHKRILTAEDIWTYRVRIHELYKSISDHADFNAFVLHPEYFFHLKTALGDRMTVTAYFDGDEMMSFHTSIHNGEVLDAHFLGYDFDANEHYKLYQNMLLDLIDEGIRYRFKTVDFSRTAVEIKSTVGAIPKEMTLYMRHENKLLQKVTEPILQFVKPSAQYEIRSPFKDE
jgi:hypothetical protein